MHLAFLVIVSSATLTQFLNELREITDRPQGLGSLQRSKNVKDHTFYNTKIIKDPLTPSHEFFDGSFDRGEHGIVTTYDTFRTRHGSPVYQKWKKRHKSQNTESKTSLMEQLRPGNLKGCFKEVILDEGHILRNRGTVLWTAVGWIEADFHLRISITFKSTRKVSRNSTVPSLNRTP